MYMYMYICMYICMYIVCIFVCIYIYTDTYEYIYVHIRYICIIKTSIPTFFCPIPQLLEPPWFPSPLWLRLPEPSGGSRASAPGVLGFSHGKGGFSSPKIGIWMIWSWKIKIENGIWSWKIGIEPTQILGIKKPFSFPMKFQAFKLWAWEKLMGFDQPKGIESAKVGSWALGLNQNHSNSTCKTNQETRNRRILAEQKEGWNQPSGSSPEFGKSSWYGLTKFLPAWLVGCLFLLHCLHALKDHTISNLQGRRNRKCIYSNTKVSRVKHLFGMSNWQIPTKHL